MDPPCSDHSVYCWVGLNSFLVERCCDGQKTWTDYRVHGSSFQTGIVVCLTAENEACFLVAMLTDCLPYETAVRLHENNHYSVELAVSMRTAGIFRFAEIDSDVETEVPVCVLVASFLPASSVVYFREKVDADFPAGTLGDFRVKAEIEKVGKTGVGSLVRTVACFWVSFVTGSLASAVGGCWVTTGSDFLVRNGAGFREQRS